MDWTKWFLYFVFSFGLDIPTDCKARKCPALWIIKGTRHRMWSRRQTIVASTPRRVFNVNEAFIVASTKTSEKVGQTNEGRFQKNNPKLETILLWEHLFMKTSCYESNTLWKDIVIKATRYERNSLWKQFLMKQG